MIKTVDIDKENILKTFKLNKKELLNETLECIYKNQQWIIKPTESNLLYDGEIILNITWIKHINEIVVEFKINVEFIKIIKKQYQDLNKIALVAEMITETVWKINVSEQETLYYGSCIIKFNE